MCNEYRQAVEALERWESFGLAKEKKPNQMGQGINTMPIKPGIQLGRYMEYWLALRNRNAQVAQAQGEHPDSATPGSRPSSDKEGTLV